MRILEALRAAARESLKRWPILAVYYACNLAAAIVVIAPVVLYISVVLGHSLESDRLFTNFDLSWAAEIIRDGGMAAGWTVGAVAGITALLYLPLNTFLAGGALAVAIDGRKSFFGSGARYLPRLLRLMLCAIPCYALVLVLSGGLLKLIAKAGENSIQEYPWVILGWGRVVLIVALFWFVNATFDYAKIIMISEGRSGAVAAAIDSVRLIWLQPQCAAIFFAGQLFGILFLLIYHGISEATPQTSMVMVGLLFLVRQIYTLVRFWVRLWVWNAETHYYGSLRGRPLLLEMENYPALAPTHGYAATIAEPSSPLVEDESTGTRLEE